MVAEETSFTGAVPIVWMGAPKTAMPGGNPMTVTTAAPGTSDATPASSTNDTDNPRAMPPSVVENVTALRASSY